MQNYKKRILFVEDNVRVSIPVCDYLKNEGFDVFNAYEIEVANDYLKDKKNKFDFIITDLDMNCVGLSEKEAKESRHGNLSGWIWLKNYVLNKNIISIDRVLVYSDYINILKNECKDEVLEKITCISKGDTNMTPIKFIEIIKGMILRKELF